MTDSKTTTKKAVKKRQNIVSVIAPTVVVIIAIIVAAVLVMNGHQVSTVIDYGEDKQATITVGEDDTELVESGQGEVGDEVEVTEVDGEEIKTVESVDSTTPVVNTDLEEMVTDDVESGRGALFPEVDVSTWSAFKDATLKGCYDLDGYYGEQCWDLADLFWLNYANRSFTTCSSGSAKGAAADGCKEKNAGSEFIIVENAEEIQAGDWVVFSMGTYGHVGMAVGSYNNGYVTLLGQNQGGGLCEGSTMGGRTNIVNISLKTFLTAFRPVSYIVETETEETGETEETEEAEDTSEETYTVKTGDSLGQILRDLGYTGELWGNEGKVQEVAEENGISNPDLIYPGKEIVISL